MQHPERSVLDLVITAKSSGATTLNHTSVVAIRSVENGLNLMTLNTVDKDVESSIKSRLVIDCTGGENKLTNIVQTDKTTYVRAVNLILDIPSAKACFTANLHQKTGSRLLLLCPWKNFSMAGTWYFPLDKSATLTLTQPEIDIMLADINEMIVENIDIDNVINIHLGLLPLDDSYQESGNLFDSLAKRSSFYRDTDNPLLFRIEGIKYTSALFDSRRILDRILKIAGIRKNLDASDLAQMPLRSKVENPEDLASALLKTYTFCSSSVVERLLFLYGSCSTLICQIAEKHPEMQAPIPGIDNSLQAELQFLISEEMPVQLSDMLMRRLSEGALQLPSQEAIEFVADFMARKLAWTNRQRSEQIQHFYKYFGFGLASFKDRS